MNNQDFMDSTGRSPVIAAIKDDDWLKSSLTSSCEIVYILYGNLCNIGEIVHQVKASGKAAIVHVDLINGFSNKEICIDFLKNNTEADGIISTKPNLIRRANELDLFTIERFFMTDFLSYENIKKRSVVDDPDVIEIMPAGETKIIRLLLSRKLIDKPIVASGLILDTEDILESLKAGAVAISTTNRVLWRCC